MLRACRASACQSPYLDAHGEEDVELRRGRPLALAPACFAQLSQLWAAGALDFDSYMLRNCRPLLPAAEPEAEDEAGGGQD
jgi:E3 ubiquitin-protein ligase UBR3